MESLLSKCGHCNADYEKKDWRSKYCSVNCRNKRDVEVRREWLRNQPYEKRRDYDLKKAYGIVYKDYENMLKFQKGLCAICGVDGDSTKKGLYVDHNHDTGKVRALLCSKCNTSLGGVGDSIELLQKAIDYLEGYENVPTE